MTSPVTHDTRLVCILLPTSVQALTIRSRLSAHHDPIGVLVHGDLLPPILRARTGDQFFDLPTGTFASKEELTQFVHLVTNTRTQRFCGSPERLAHLFDVLVTALSFTEGVCALVRLLDQHADAARVEPRPPTAMAVPPPPPPREESAPAPAPATRLATEATLLCVGPTETSSAQALVNIANTKGKKRGRAPSPPKAEEKSDEEEEEPHGLRKRPKQEAVSTLDTRIQRHFSALEADAAKAPHFLFIPHPGGVSIAKLPLLAFDWDQRPWSRLETTLFNVMLHNKVSGTRTIGRMIHDARIGWTLAILGATSTKKYTPEDLLLLSDLWVPGYERTCSARSLNPGSLRSIQLVVDHLHRNHHADLWGWYHMAQQQPPRTARSPAPAPASRPPVLPTIVEEPTSSPPTSALPPLIPIRAPLAQ